MKSIRLIYIILLMVAVFGCRNKEIDSRSVRIKSAGACCQVLGRTPLDCAQDLGYTEIVELLRKHGDKE